MKIIAIIWLIMLPFEYIFAQIGEFSLKTGMAYNRLYPDGKKINKQEIPNTFIALDYIINPNRLHVTTGLFAITQFYKLKYQGENYSYFHWGAGINVQTRYRFYEWKKRKCNLHEVFVGSSLMVRHKYAHSVLMTAGFTLLIASKHHVFLQGNLPLFYSPASVPMTFSDATQVALLNREVFSVVIGYEWIIHGKNKQ